VGFVLRSRAGVLERNTLKLTGGGLGRSKANGEMTKFICFTSARMQPKAERKERNSGRCQRRGAAAKACPSKNVDVRRFVEGQGQNFGWLRPREDVVGHDKG